MRSPEEQEDFLQHGRFGEGVPTSRALKPGALTGPAGALLILAASLGTGTFRWFDIVDGQLPIAFLLGTGSIVCAALTFTERTGLASLVGAIAILLCLFACWVHFPAQRESAIGDGILLLIGCFIAFLAGSALLIVTSYLRPPS